MKMTKLSLLSPAFLVLLLASCVTVNIYFPAAAAEDAARTIVRDVMGEKAQDTGEQEGAAPEKDQGQGDGTGSGAMLDGVPAEESTWLAGVVDWLFPSAHAQTREDLKIDTPAINRLRSSMRSRQDRLRPYFRSGAIGLTQEGLVQIRDRSAIPLAERNKVRKLVAEENEDRNALYKEIARANGHPEWTSRIRAIFADVWVEEAPRSYWYQNDQGQWVQR